MPYKEKIKEEIQKAVQGAASVTVEKPKLKEHGDASSNIAMILAKELKKNPFDIAQDIKEKAKLNTSLISNIEVAKPGFLNFTLSNAALAEFLHEASKLKSNYGFSKSKTKEKVLVEFVSANPTGDLHIGHGRQAVLGSALASLLEKAGHDVYREFYVNDYGEQIVNLSETAWAIYQKSKGEKYEWKESFYPEDTTTPFVKEVLDGNPPGITKESLGQATKELILKSQQDLLSSFEVNFDKWFSETSLHKSKEVEKVLQKLKEKGCTYEHEGALWFKAEEYGDVRDRVLIKSDGKKTYLLADIAYHIDKLNRSEKLITIWGADHQGQEVSLKGALKALGYDDTKLEIVFVQLVSLKKQGQEVKMSKRAGNVITVKEVLDEVGKDAVRYFLVESHANNRMVFDVDLAKKQDKDNPVFYVQYAHARCCSIFRQIDEKGGLKQDGSKEVFLNLFKVNNQEYQATKDLILKILDFSEEVTNAATNRAPNRIANYLKELASDFHQFYTVCRVISDNEELTKARLQLVDILRTTIHNGLKILGITAPNAM